jgi:uncharacterized delta-60 repeat protein
MHGSRSWRRSALTLCLLGLVAPSIVGAAAGDLDPSFGAGGIVQTSLTSMEDRANAGALQPDGKILAGGGKFMSSSTEDFAVVRYQPNGILDPTFGTGGVVTTNVGTIAEVESVVVQPDGKIVAAGYIDNGGGNLAMALVRYDAFGGLDPTFGSGGIVVSTLGPGTGIVRHLLRQPDGKLVAIGEVRVGSAQSFGAARFESDGSVDTGFGTGGEVVTDASPFFDFADDAVLQPDGRIVAAGTVFFRPGLVRWNADGTLDTSFGSGGVATLSSVSGYGTGVVIQPDGKLVVGGEELQPSGKYDVALGRFDASGTLDPTYGTGGVVRTALGPDDDFNLALALQPDGKVVAIGQTTTGFSTSSFAVIRYETDGTLDAGFGTGGIATTPFGFFVFASPFDVVLQPDHRIVLVGSRTNFGPRDFLLTRYFGGECGNGTVELGEQCDDGNTLDGDCCTSRCAFDVMGTACTTDGDACTNDECNASGTCGHTPVTCALCETCDSAIGCYEGPSAGCLGIAPGGRSSFQVKDRLPNTSDVARWKWQSGLVAVGDFGDPLATDDYALCVYQGAGQTLWARRTAPAGGACHFRPCWKALAPNGAKYADRELTPDGVSSLLLRSNVPGRVQLKWKGKGTSLALPSLGTLSLPVRVQLQRTGGACWDVTYATAKTATPATFTASAQ